MPQPNSTHPISQQLNASQAIAVTTLAGPMLVLAGAGTGKTRVVTFRIANLIRHGIVANRILAVTFTNKAAQEMQERIGHQLKLPKRPPRRSRSEKEKVAPLKPVVGTFHSTCVQILKRHAKALGYPTEFTIFDRNDQESVARGVLRELRIHDEMLKPSDFLSIVGGWKNAGVIPSIALSAAKSDREHLAAAGYNRYQKALKLQGAFDFDDLLLCTEELLSNHEAIRKQESSRFDHLLVDEYQDTNGSQYRIIRALAIDHRNLCVVGDDDQSIYGWRGAEVRHILNFKQDWPDATVVRLEDNYRSTAAILKAANDLIVFNKERHDKTLQAARPNGSPPRILYLPDETEEARSIATEIAKRLESRIAGSPNAEPRDFAILFRTNEQPRVFESELRRVKLPYTLTGTQSFFDRKEVRDLLAYLRWIDKPSDEVSLLRVINVPPRGLGAKSIETLMNAAVNSGKTIWDVLLEGTVLQSLPPNAQRGVEQLRAIQETYKKLFDTTDDMVAILRQLITHLRYADEVRRLNAEPEDCDMRLSTIEEMVNAFAQYEEEADQPTISDFLSTTMLAGREFGSPKEKEMKRNAISLMTLHSAKGLEFPFVYMVGMEEGFLPHRRSVAEAGKAIDEERRLCYVGVTRAQDELTLTLAQARMKWGKARPTLPSRFLYEIAGQADNPNRLKIIQSASKEFRSGGGGGATGKKESKKSSKRKSSRSSRANHEPSSRRYVLLAERYKRNINLSLSICH